MITETGDDSTPVVFVYDEAEWAAVVATFPDPLADGAEINAEREGLEFVATSYLNLSHHIAVAPRTVFRRRRGSRSVPAPPPISRMLRRLAPSHRCCLICARISGVLMPQLTAGEYLVVNIRVGKIRRVIGFTTRRSRCGSGWAASCAYRD
jgi:hypothetical protein